MHPLGLQQDSISPARHNRVPENSSCMRPRPVGSLHYAPLLQLPQSSQKNGSTDISDRHVSNKSQILFDQTALSLYRTWT